MADVDDETRQYLRILAESTKNSVQLVSLEGSLKQLILVAILIINRPKRYLIRYRLIKEWRLRSLQKRKHGWLRKIRSSKTANDSYDLDRYFTSSFCFPASAYFSVAQERLVSFG